MSGDFAQTSRSLGIATTRVSLLNTWRKLQEPWGELPGLDAVEAAEVLGSDIATFYSWAEAYEADGLEGLAG